MKLVEFQQGDKPRTWTNTLWPLATMGVLAAAYVVEPSEKGHGTHTQLGLPPCPCLAVTGRPCPACGLTTCFALCARGQLATAFTVHPVGPLLFIGMLILASIYGLAWVRRQDVFYTKLGSRVIAAVLIVFVAFGLVRFFFMPPWTEPLATLYDFISR